MRKFVRENDARTAKINWNSIVGQGSFKIVCCGEYVDGDRHGQPCVAKRMLDPRVAPRAFDKELEIIQKARELVKKFNDAKMIDKRVVLNIPEVWEDEHQRQLLVEPFLKHFENFNSNTGFVKETNSPWVRVMQALSHYSYHVSSGQFLLCDLQGAVNTNEVVLTDPVVLSRNGRFGPADLGSEGMENFFHWHTCTEYCHPQWQVPKRARYYHQPRLGTSMTDGKVMIVPTCAPSTRSSLDTSIPTLNASSRGTSLCATVKNSLGTDEPGTPGGLVQDTSPWLPNSLLEDANARGKEDLRASRISKADAQQRVEHPLAGVSIAPVQSAHALCFPAPALAGGLPDPAAQMDTQPHFSLFSPTPVGAPAPGAARQESGAASTSIPNAIPAEMDPVCGDPTLQTEFSEGSGQRLQQSLEHDRVLDLMMQGEQFVEQASAAGIISDPADLVRRFMRPHQNSTRAKPSPLIHRSQQRARELYTPIAPDGAPVANFLQDLICKPIYTEGDISLIKDLIPLVEKLKTRLPPCQETQLKAAASQQAAPSPPAQPVAAGAEPSESQPEMDEASSSHKPAPGIRPQQQIAAQLQQQLRELTEKVALLQMGQAPDPVASGAPPQVGDPHLQTPSGAASARVTTQPDFEEADNITVGLSANDM